MKRLQTFTALVALSTLSAASVKAESIAVSSPSPEFGVYTMETSAYPVATASEISQLPPLYLRDGETVTITAPDGTTSQLTGTTISFSQGGLWTLVNSAQGSAKIGIAWAINNDGGSLALGETKLFRADAKEEGPDRRIARQYALPVMYPSDVSSLTFTAPDGTETAATLDGTGIYEFNFASAGDWTVNLTLIDGTLYEATISIYASGTVVSLIGNS